MTETRATLRRWGSSLAAVIPPEVLRREHLREGDEIVLEVRKTTRPGELFGLLRGDRLDSQATKDRLRREDNE